MSQERVRSVDVSRLTPEDADRLSVQIGEKVRQICDQAVENANRLLNIYGMEAKMQFAVGKIGELTEKAEEPSKTRKTRKKKNTNL